MRLALLALLSTTALAQQCYFPDGNKVNSDTACNPNALVSACCYKNQACLSNGLCVSDPHDPVKARLHRGTCTDAQWKSGNCPRQCLDVKNNGVPVYSCNSTTSDAYCCYDGCDCRANSGSNIFSFAQAPADVYTVTIIGESFTQTHISTTSSSTSPSSISTSASASASTTAPTSTPTPTPASTPAPAEPSSKTNTTALGVGLGVGIPAAAFLAAGLFFFLRRRRNRDDSTPSELAADEYTLDAAPQTTKYAYVGEEAVPRYRDTSPDGPDVAEVSHVHELSGEGEKRVELPGQTTTPPSPPGVQAVELDSPLGPRRAG